jgi:hypothetical protein
MRNLLVVPLLAAVLAAQPAVPSTLPFQGRLTLQAGGNVNGVVAVTFKIYNVATGGAARWTEANPSVAVSNGLFALELGGITGFPTDLFDGRTLYLGVSVGNNPEMTPRLPIPSQAYAQLAADAVDVKGKARVVAPRAAWGVQGLPRPAHRCGVTELRPGYVATHMDYPCRCHRRQERSWSRTFAKTFGAGDESWRIRRWNPCRVT